MPFRIADNLYYVGSRDLASYLVVTPAGDILINANLATSPAQIRASVRKLGFRWEEIRILLNSQGHADHMAGAAEILRETHARNMVMDGDVSVVETGGKTDFLSPSHNISLYVPAHVDRILHDGDTVSLGGVTLTAHKTAGHTRGCTTWTMRSHLPGEAPGVLRNIVIVGGTGFWSEYHFIATPGHPVSYPGIVQDFRHTFAVLRELPCDVFLGAHGQYFDSRSSSAIRRLDRASSSIRTDITSPLPILKRPSRRPYTPSKLPRSEDPSQGNALMENAAQIGGGATSPATDDGRVAHAIAVRRCARTAGLPSQWVCCSHRK